METDKTIITIFSKEDIKKSGGFKKKNNILEMNKESFFKYLNENNLNIESEYIDRTGKITNGKRFKCDFKGFIIGTSGIVKEFNLK